jgi:hypothetical protein
MNRRGSVAVEAALALGLVLVPLLLALSDLGLALSVQMRLERANQAALFYAWGTSGASVASIKSAASAGYGISDPSFAAAASEACYCISPTGTRLSGTAVACTASCASGQQIATWLTVAASASVALPVPLPGYGSSIALSSGSTARVQ